MNTYFVKVALRKVSPMIWRKLRVHSNTSLADLHYIIQAAMDWSNEYLHSFRIYGEDYGVSYEGGMSFNHNARQVFLKDQPRCISGCQNEWAKLPRPGKPLTVGIDGTVTLIKALIGWKTATGSVMMRRFTTASAVS